MAGLNNAAPSLRAQCGAVAFMRWRVLLNSLRTKHGGFEIGSRIIMQGLFAMIGLGMGVGLGFIAWQIASRDSLRLLAALLWPVLAVWQFVPIAITSFQENADLSLFLRFPLNFRTYLLFYIWFGLFDVSSIVGGIALLGILVGASIAQPGLFFWIALVLVAFALFNVLLTRMIFSWIDRWLAQRRTREILGIVFLFLILGAQLLNPAFYHHGFPAGEISQATMTRGFHIVERVQALLPPGLAANAVSDAHAGQWFTACANFVFLAFYAGIAGNVLCLRLRAEYRGESLGEAPAQAKKRARPRGHLGPLEGSGPVSAIVEKEIRYLMRSGVMLYGFLAPLVIVFLFSGGPHNPHAMSFAGQYALPLGVAYSFLGLTRFVYNNLGGEGAGIQLYFLSPVPIRKVLLAKNIVHTMIFLVELVLVCVIVRFRAGLPGLQIVILTFCWLLFAVPAQLAIGNVLSITMPYRLNMTRMSREQGAAANGLISLLVELFVFAVGAVVYVLLRSTGHPDLVAPVFLVLALGSVILWLGVLAKSASLFQSRQETLISTLYKTA